MSLVDRLAGVEGPKLATHTFWAALSEFANSEVTKAQIVAYFDLDATEEAELDWIIAAYSGQPNAAAKARFIELMHVIFMLAEAQVPGYTTNAQITARINAI